MQYLDALWNEVLALDEKGRQQEAVQKLLDSNDDIYLIRYLMYKSGEQVLGGVNKGSAQRILQRFMEIYSSRFMETLCMNFVEDMLDNPVARQVVNE